MANKALRVSLFASVVAAAAMGISLFQSARVTQQLADVRDGITQQGARTAKQLSDLEGLLARLSAESVQMERKLAELGSRSREVIRAERESRLSSESVTAQPPPMSATVQDDAHAVADPLTGLQREHPVVRSYYDEWGQSEWGLRAVEALERAIPNQQFFSEYGGTLVADCKQSTCRVEWQIPDVSPSWSDDKMEVLAKARYEMLALTAKNVGDVGQLATQWERAGDSVVGLSTTFKRPIASD